MKKKCIDFEKKTSVSNNCHNLEFNESYNSNEVFIQRVILFRGILTKESLKGLKRYRF